MSQIGPSSPVPKFLLVRQRFEGQPVEAEIAISVERELERMDRVPAAPLFFDTDGNLPATF